VVRGVDSADLERGSDGFAVSEGEERRRTNQSAVSSRRQGRPKDAPLSRGVISDLGKLESMEKFVRLKVGDSRVDFLALEDGNERESVLDDLGDEYSVDVERSMSRERRAVEVDSRRNWGSETVERRSGSRENVAAKKRGRKMRSELVSNRAKVEKLSKLTSSVQQKSIPERRESLRDRSEPRYLPSFDSKRASRRSPSSSTASRASETKP